MRSFLDRGNYLNYRHYLNEEDIGKDLLPILNGIDIWYRNNVVSPTPEDISNIVFSLGIIDSKKEYLKSILSNLGSPDGSTTVGPLLERLKTNKILERISVAAFEAAHKGKPIDNVLSLVRELNQEVEQEEFVTDDIESLISNTVATPGLRWRLDSLNKAVGSLRKGDFGVVFARPETGKTTFLASEVTFMANQLSPESGPILWLNNEERGEKVKLRCYQAALGATLDRIQRDPRRAYNVYKVKTKGKILLYDSAYITRKFVDSLAERYRPSLIVFDQLDKIKGFSADREDLVLGNIYQWARELAKQYCPVIGVSQADASAEGIQWLYMDNVANAKTSKQAEADLILGIGKLNTPEYEYVRFFNICKNKLLGDQDTDPSLRHHKWEVLIKPDIARYEDI